MKVCRTSEMKNLERQAIDKFGIPQEILMENAGEAIYFVILSEFGVANKEFTIFCGTGNNGGDGFVTARKLYSNGAKVKVFLLGKKNKLTGATKKNFEIISSIPIEINSVESIKRIKDSILRSDAIVDAIFGTGLTKDVVCIHRDIIRMINKYGKMIFSVDIPSGVNCNTGEVMGIAVNADYTITFGLPKIGNMLYPGFEHGGKLYVSHISFPPSLYNSETIKVEIFHPLKLPRRKKNTHKGNYGKTLFIAGSSNYLGAPYFSALSFLKSGGGLSYLAAPKSICSIIAGKGSEIIVLPQSETESGSIADKNIDFLLDFSKKVDMIVLGPGISLNEKSQDLVRQIAGRVRKTLLIDGDGITAISENLNLIMNRKAKTILTPHLGEMARIAKIEINELTKHKIDVLQQKASELNAIIVLKGSHSLIGYPNEKVYINTSGNPGMATAGVGDVLNGTIAAMYGLGFSIENAVPLGVFIHGLSGDLAAREIGEDGIIARDVLDYLPSALRYYRDNFDETIRDYYGTVRII